MSDPLPLPDPARPGAAFPGATGAPASCRELFLAFNRLALQGFGGVLAVAQHELVERQGWLTRPQFVELLSAAQVLPGPNIVNLSMMIGDRFFGRRGALSALAGMMLAPLAVVLAVAALYGRFAEVPAVAGALRGMGAVAAGLVMATALKLLPSLKGNAMGPGVCGLLTLATVAAVAVLRLPLAAVLAVLGGAGFAWAFWKLRR